MAHIEWSMQGLEFSNCNCDLGCPCQFNSLPTHGDCRALSFVQIERGRFGDVPLDGLRWGIFASWPKAIHLGNGTFQTYIDERADPKQRAAIEAISHGKETDAGALIWQVFSTTISRYLPTLSGPIDLSVDVGEATAQLKIAGLVDAGIRPIANPITGLPHRVQVVLPKGFEFQTAEFARGTSRVGGDIPLDFVDTHAHLARIHWSTHGVVH